MDEVVESRVSPRPYRLGQRQAASDRTRARIVEAARQLLAADGGPAGFTLDAVARRAGVARMTVYYQFGSKAGLLEGLFDALASRGGMHQLPAVFQREDGLATLDGLIGVFVGFWASDRLVIRRVRALAALDPDFERTIGARDQGRRRAAAAILGRLSRETGRPDPDSMGWAIDLLHLLSGFETFDSLAGPDRSPAEVADLLRRLVRSALGL